MSSKENSPDLNLANYTTSDMLNILGLTDINNLDDIYTKTDYYINLSDSRNNQKMVNFFTNMQELLVNMYNQGQTDETNETDENNDLYARSGNPSSNQQTGNWIQNGALKQNDREQSGKNTDRKQKMDVYNDNHVPMNREHLGISNTYQVPAVQDILNPNLKNAFNRFISLDSQYRQSGFPNSADYIADLSDIMTNVLSLRLYSLQIPYSWYNFDIAYLNTNFVIRVYTGISPYTISNISINIPSGNYDGTGLQNAINTAITNSGLVGFSVNYNSTSYKMTFLVGGGTGGVIVPMYGVNAIAAYDIIWYESGKYGFGIAETFTQTLGWAIGYRNISYTNTSLHTEFIGEAVINTVGAKYLILSIDDFNQNHINNSLVSITEPSRNIKVPNYVTSSDMIGTTTYGTTLEQDAELAANANNNILNVMDKVGASYTKTPVVVGLTSTGKQTLTQPQMYTANQILKNNSITTTYKNIAPTTSDVFAIIPVKPGSAGSVYVEFGGTVQDNKRIYFGPVNIERLKIRLYNDKGMLLNLNGLDWSITLLAEMLYQY